MVHLANATEILTLDTRRLVALRDTTGLVEDANGAQRIWTRPGHELHLDTVLMFVANAEVIPPGGGEELLQGANGGAGDQGVGLDGFARCGSEQCSTVRVEMFGGACVVAEAAKRPQVVGEGRSEIANLLICHGFPPDNGFYRQSRSGAVVLLPGRIYHGQAFGP